MRKDRADPINIHYWHGGCGYYNNVDRFLSYARQKQNDLIALIGEFVKCESPSDDPPSVDRFVALLSDRVRDIARVRTFPGGSRYGKHLRCEFTLPGAKKAGQILSLGHSDTVWPLGTLAS